MKKSCVLVLAFAVTLALAQAQDSWDTTSAKLVLKIYDDCLRDDGFSPCLKKKAVTFLDRLSRMEKLSIGEGITVQRTPDAGPIEPVVTEEQLETTLPRAADAKDQALTTMLLDKVSKFISSRSIDVTLPKITPSDFIGEGRKKSGGSSGGGGMKGMMGGMMMGMAAKMAALIPIAIAGLFLLAGKALITAKIALLISGIIAIKKLFASKSGGGGGGGGHGWQSGGGGGGGGGGWQSSGGGWDKRSLDEANKLAYNAYSPK